MTHVRQATSRVERCIGSSKVRSSKASCGFVPGSPLKCVLGQPDGSPSKPRRRQLPSYSLPRRSASGPATTDKGTTHSNVLWTALRKRLLYSFLSAGVPQ